MPAKRKSAKKKDSTASLGFEAKLWLAAEEVEDDGEPFEEKMPRLISELESQCKESANLKGLGYAL